MAVNKFDNSMLDAGTIGTTANKLLQLDGSAKIPAIDGSLLTGIASSFTKNASDPAIATNPAGGVGTIWVNTTSGETYCCTDATAGANVWTNVGAGSDNIKPYSFQGSNYGYCSGGYSWNGSIANWNYIDRWSYASTGNAVDVGDLEVPAASGAQQGIYRAAAASSETHGYVLGGAGAHDEIEKFSFATGTENASHVADLLSTAKGETVGWTNGTYAYTAGWTEPDPGKTIIQKFVYATDADAVDSGGDLSRGRAKHVTTQTTTYGYAVGGMGPSSGATATNSIDKWQFETTNTATDVADLLGDRRDGGWGSSSLTHGYVAGGTTAVAATKVNSIEKHQFSNDANSTDVGDLAGTYYAYGSNSSTTHAFGFGRQGGTSVGSNEITVVAFSSDGNATDWGDLTQIRMWGQGHQF